MGSCCSEEEREELATPALCYERMDICYSIKFQGDSEISPPLTLLQWPVEVGSSAHSDRIILASGQIVHTTSEKKLRDAVCRYYTDRAQSIVLLIIHSYRPEAMPAAFSL
jgi:hypothetical protein